MRTIDGPPQIAVYRLRPGEPITVFRIVRAEHPEDPVFVNSFRSNYDLGSDPRKIERASSVIHMGISAYLDEGIARETARMWEKLGIG